MRHFDVDGGGQSGDCGVGCAVVGVDRERGFVGYLRSTKSIMIIIKNFIVKPLDLYSIQKSLYSMNMFTECFF